MEDTIIKKNNIYQIIEEEFNVIYPSTDNATYFSQLNFSIESTTRRQRWYRYKEGYSIELVKGLINKYLPQHSTGVILDPFLGSGSTIIGANELGLAGIGFETNPFSYFLSKCKLDNYTEDEITNYKNAVDRVMAEVSTCENKFPLPQLSIASKVFAPEVEDYYMKLKWLIRNLKFDQKTENLLMLGWLSCLETVSNYRKAGNGLKRKTSLKNRIETSTQAKNIINKQYSTILEDLQNTSLNFSARILNDTSLNMNKYIDNNKINGIIFSPPYANAFDYTEIYKLELWFGDFVNNYDDMKKLRQQSLRSHLNGLSIKTDYRNLGLTSSPILDRLIDQLLIDDLWDKKIPLMLRMYYSQMFDIIRQSYQLLIKGGFCSIVVGNSSYSGIVFPTDLILAKYAKSIGFKVDCIDVDRYIITSSQQYEKTKENRKFLRESTICLIKE